MCHLPAKQSRAFTVFRSDSKRSCDVGLGYKTLAGNIAKFRDHDSMPMQIDLSQLDEGDGLENALVRCKARCLKSCHDLFNSTKSKRAVKKHAIKSEQPVGGKYSTHVQLRLHLSTIVVRAFFVESILHVRTIFTMSQHLV